MKLRAHALPQHQAPIEQQGSPLHPKAPNSGAKSPTRSPIPTHPRATDQPAAAPKVKKSFPITSSHLPNCTPPQQQTVPTSVPRGAAVITPHQEPSQKLLLRGGGQGGREGHRSLNNSSSCSSAPAGDTTRSRSRWAPAVLCPEPIPAGGSTQVIAAPNPVGEEDLPFGLAVVHACNYSDFILCHCLDISRGLSVSCECSLKHTHYHVLVILCILTLS